MLRPQVIPFLFFLAAGLVTFSADVAAQLTPADSTLPELAPSEYEIRGQANVILPPADRPPLTGFETPPRVAQIPEGRRPYTEDYRQNRSDLPASPIGRPEPPAISSLSGREPINGEFEASAGRYLSRLVRARVGLPLSGAEAFVARVLYRGSDGHQPFDTEPYDALRTGYDVLEGSAGISSNHTYFSAGGMVEGYAENYTLYGARRTIVPTIPTVPERRGTDAGAQAWLTTRGENRAVIDVRVRYGVTKYEDDWVVGGPMDDRTTPTLSENRLNAGFTLRTPFATNQGMLDAAFSTATLDGIANDNTTVEFSGAAGYGFRSGNSMEIMLGARLLTYTVSDNTSSGRTETLLSGTYVAPDVRLDVYPANGVKLYAQNTPRIQSNALAETFRRNPYLVSEPSIRPSLSTIDAEGGVSVYSGPLQLAARAGFQYFPRYLYFENAGDLESGFRAGVMAVRYDEARILSAGGDLSVVLPGGFQATVGATVRDGRLTFEKPVSDETDDSIIPYFGPIVGRGMISYSFLEGRALIQAVAEYESARYNDRDETRKIGDFFDADIVATYNVTPGMGIGIRLENLSAGYLDRWGNYPLSPTVIGAGINIKW